MSGVATNTRLSRQNTYFVATKVCFVATKLCLSRQNIFSRQKLYLWRLPPMIVRFVKIHLHRRTPVGLTVACVRYDLSWCFMSTEVIRLIRDVEWKGSRVGLPVSSSSKRSDPQRPKRPFSHRQLRTTMLIKP